MVAKQTVWSWMLKWHGLLGWILSGLLALGALGWWSARTQLLAEAEAASTVEIHRLDNRIDGVQTQVNELKMSATRNAQRLENIDQNITDIKLGIRRLEDRLNK